MRLSATSASSASQRAGAGQAGSPGRARRNGVAVARAGFAGGVLAKGSIRCSCGERHCTGRPEEVSALHGRISRSLFDFAAPTGPDW